MKHSFVHYDYLILTQNLFRTSKINISIGNELYHDIEQICRNRLSSQTLSNVKKT